MIHTLSAVYPVQSICDLCDFPRSSYYYWLEQSRFNQTNKIEEEANLVAAIERISLEHHRYGYRRITKQLKREGFKLNGQYVNHKRVLRLMRENRLLVEVKGSFIVTTDSAHLHKKYENLLRKEAIKVTNLNQVWVSDISYVRLKDNSFVYVAVVIDAYSRKVIGYSVSEHIDAELVVKALQMAIKERGITDAKQTIIHHSDQGVQYACKEYTDLLTFHGIRISMSRKGSPWENGIAESFFKTLKYEEVYLNEYEDLQQVEEGLVGFIERVYNADRLHSSIGYQTPIEFEQQQLTINVKRPN